MEIKTIDQAKKYLGKCVYTAHNFNARKSGSKNKVAPLYIGGVHLFYNQVTYEVMGFELYEDEKCSKGWGEVKLNRIEEKWDAAKNPYACYFFSKEEAGRYCEWLNRDESEKNRERDIETAKELLQAHSIKFEILD